MLILSLEPAFRSGTNPFSNAKLFAELPTYFSGESQFVLSLFQVPFGLIVGSIDQDIVLFCILRFLFWLSLKYMAIKNTFNY